MIKPYMIAISGMILMTQPSWATCASPGPNVQISRPDSRYTDNLDGTVMDEATGLTWTKCSIGQLWEGNAPEDGADDSCSGTALAYNWKGALDIAQTANDVNYLGASDWRVPNVKDLGSLLENACSSPPINTSMFPSTANANYWTSSPYGATGLDLEAWYVGFQSRGEILHEMKSRLYNVRLVRGGD